MGEKVDDRIDLENLERVHGQLPIDPIPGLDDLWTARPASPACGRLVRRPALGDEGRPGSALIRRAVPDHTGRLRRTRL